MHIADVTNGLFEALGGMLVWLNVRRILIDKQVKGTDGYVVIFFSAWGWWNLYYYPSLNQWLSTAGAVLMALANTTWLILFLRLKRAQHVS